MDNLVSCDDCGNLVSLRAVTCPNCGSLVQTQAGVKAKLAEIKREQDKIAAAQFFRIVGNIACVILLFCAYRALNQSVMASILFLIAAILASSIIKDLLVKAKPNINRKVYSLVSAAFFIFGIMGINSSPSQDAQTIDVPEAAQPVAANSNADLEKPINQPYKIIPKDKDYSKVVDIAKRKDAPKFYDKWGKATIDRSNRLIKKAARQAEESPDCDSVEWVAMSDNMSKPDEIVWYADCTNGNRRYISEKMLHD